MKKILFLLTIILSLASVVYAAEEIQTSVDRLNFWSGETINFSVTQTGALDTNVTYQTADMGSLCGTWVVTDAGPSGVCAEVATNVVNCSLSTSEVGYFTMTAPTTGVIEYQRCSFNQNNSNNSYTARNAVDFVRLQEGEIFHTLIEYGRGRGNYMYDTFSGKGQSGATATGYTFLPESQIVELNYLHKVQNPQQYWGRFNSILTDANFTCDYPNSTMVRGPHLANAISRATNFSINYTIDQVKASWERMGYIGQRFDTGEYNNGNTINIRCYNMVVGFGDEYGKLVATNSNVTLSFQDDDPINLSINYTATQNYNGLGTIGKGIIEVQVDFTLNNSETYDMYDVDFEIQAPQNATWIGTRGELWGTSKDRYIYHLTTMASGTSDKVSLLARFDTSGKIADANIKLSRGVKISFVPPWEYNSYNPIKSIISKAPAETIAYDTDAQATNITNVQQQLNNTYNLLLDVNRTVIQINNTVNTINTIVNQINTTSNNIWATLINVNDTVNFMNDTLLLGMNNTIGSIWTVVQQINITSNNIFTGVVDINTTVKQINNSANNIINNLTAMRGVVDIILNQTNCSITLAGSESQLCIQLDQLNTTSNNMFTTITNINTTTLQINTTVAYLNNTIWNRFTNLDTNLTELDTLVDNINQMVNCSRNPADPNPSICEKLDNISTYAKDINTTIYNYLPGMNTTLFSINQSMINFSALNATLFNQIQIAITNTTNLGAQIRQFREFEEESIFLVTDSLVTQSKSLLESARDEVSNGNMIDAQEDLKSAIPLLQEVRRYIMDIDPLASVSAAESETIDVKDSGGSGNGWYAGLLLLSIGILSTVVIFKMRNNRHNYG